MQYKSLIPISMLAAMAVAQTPAEYLGDAEAITDNPVGQVYEAKFDTTVCRGSFTFTAAKDGKGVEVDVKIDGLAGQRGPFGYHIHDQPVPADGNCTGTKAHLDPYKRGAATPCDKTAPETCEVGDLAGKHGKIDDGKNTMNTTDSLATVFSQSYLEKYASTKEGIGAFLGNRSIVIHAADGAKSRIACANIELIQDSEGGSQSGYPKPTGTGSSGSGSSCNGKCPYPTDKPHGNGSGSHSGSGSGSGSGSYSGYASPSGTGYPSPSGAPHGNGNSTVHSGSSGSGSGAGSAGAVASAASVPAGPSAAPTDSEESSAVSFGISSSLAIAGVFAGLLMAL